MLALYLWRFLLLNVGNIAVPVMIGVMKLGKGIVMRGTIDPHIVNSNFFQRLQIVVNDHPPRPDDGHFPNLARLKPTTLDGREFLVTEGKRKIRDVFNS